MFQVYLDLPFWVDFLKASISFNLGLLSKQIYSYHKRVGGYLKPETKQDWMLLKDLFVQKALQPVGDK